MRLKYSITKTSKGETINGRITTAIVVFEGNDAGSFWIDGDEFQSLILQFDGNSYAVAPRHPEHDSDDSVTDFFDSVDDAIAYITLRGYRM